MRPINKDYCGGVLMIALGLGTFFVSLGYRVGSLEHMGPGYFPAAVGVLMAICGVLIALAGYGQHARAEHEPLQAQWRGWGCLLGGIVAFIVVGDFAGLLPATFAITFITALADRQNNVKTALVLSVAMSIVAVVVFWWALELQFPLLHWGSS